MQKVLKYKGQQIFADFRKFKFKFKIQKKEFLTNQDIYRSRKSNNYQYT